MPNDAAISVGVEDINILSPTYPDEPPKPGISFAVLNKTHFLPQFGNIEHFLPWWGTIIEPMKREDLQK